MVVFDFLIFFVGYSFFGQSKGLLKIGREC
jgi:hypothetical protein